MKGVSIGYKVNENDNVLVRISLVSHPILF